MTKHTPGPWTVCAVKDWSPDDPGTLCVLATGKNKAFPVAFIGSRGGNIPEEQGNAHLIAAAPAMLAALESGHEVLCELLEGRAHLGLHKDDRAMMRAALKDIRAAIAAAKGGAA